MIIVNFGGGYHSFTENRKEDKRRERLVLCKTSERRSEALVLNGRLIDFIGGDSYGN